MKKNKSSKLIWLLVGAIMLTGIIIMGTANQGVKDSKWKDMISSSSKQILYLGRPTCSWCSKFRPGLDNLKEQYNFEYIYVNTDEVSETELNALFDILEINSSEFGTPYTAIVQSGKKIDEQAGYVPENELFKFLQKHGFIEKGAKYAPNDKTIELED